MEEDAPNAGGAAPFTAALADLRGSLKWLVAAAGAAAAVLVAGLQLNSVQAGAPIWVILVGLVAVCVAIAVVLLLLVSAARVLTLPRPTATDISNLEIEAGVAYPQSEIPSHGSALVEWIQERRTYLLGDAETVTELYSDKYVRSLNIVRRLDDGKAATWRGKRLTPPGTDEERKEVEQIIASTRAMLTGVEDAAHYYLTDQKYQRLFGRRFAWAGAAFVLAVLGFALTAVWPIPAPVTQPQAVVIHVVDNARSPIPKACDAKQLEGVQVGGSVEDPVIVLSPASDQCPAMKIETTEGLVIVPVIK